MGIISKDKKAHIWESLQFHFGVSYIAVIIAVLLLLNSYPLLVSQDMVFRSKAAALQNSVSVMVYSLSGLEELTEENVQIHNVEGKQIIAITVPKADAQHRPVHIGTDPYRGSYRRCGEGDYRLTKEEIDTMLAQRR